MTQKKLTIGSLFSGIGGLELGLERTGRFKTIWQCEIEPYPSAVLKKNFPGVPNLGDITKIKWSHVEKPDMLCGGFPCQDISVAGKRKGIENGKRSGLWKEFSKAIRALRPKYVLIENVPNIVNLGLDIVLADLAKTGYDADWCCLSAAEVGACHKRERLFVFAHANAGCQSKNKIRAGREKSGGGLDAPDLARYRGGKDAIEWSISNTAFRCADGTETAEKSKTPNAIMFGCRGGDTNELGDAESAPEIQRRTVQIDVADTKRQRVHGFGSGPIPQFPEFSWCKNVKRIEDLRNQPNIPEPLIRRESHGLSRRLDNYTENERIKALGNAVVPQVAETIGNWIVQTFIKNVGIHPHYG